MEGISKSEGTLISNALRRPKELCFLKASKLLPFVLLVTATLGYRWVWSVGGKILKAKNRRTARKSCPSDT
jgi:hypothetical protein